MTRHIGVFIINTLRPLIEELDKLLGKCQYLCISRDDLYGIVRLMVELEIQKTIIKGMVSLIIGGMFCWTMWLIVK